ncbi:MAG: lipoate--protein ligase [Firmicutes bacterium HGW-Firmicutes-19]|jgi:lipoate---protein ligase|nr:MAG: lipoate--protein ligase [Firmicutes bacterium HGW-Firmicutes-19]
MWRTFMKAIYVLSPFTNPYLNLAYEDWMMDQIQDDEILFYLWQNQHTVVIGKNQNAYKECKVSELENDGGKLARRSSGGGAVYHDLGNLNFTFIAPHHQYDQHKQLRVILLALNKLGIEAKFAGRNDIEVDGCKVSGNAFAKKRNNSLHHGTLLVDVKMEDLAKYLNVSKAKMQSKGVDSVRKRVANLKQFNSELTIPLLIETLKASFEEVYQIKLNEKIMDSLQYQDRIDKYRSKEWRLNPIENYQAQVETKFSWGEIQAFFQVKSGKIISSTIYSDAMNPDFIEHLSKSWKDIPYDLISMRNAVGNKENLEMVEDILSACFHTEEQA